MARLRLAQWDSAVADCRECLRLAPDSIKAHYSLSQAYLELRAHDDALRHGLRAHVLCVGAGSDKSLATLTAHVLRCKKARWDERERARARETADLEAEVLALLERERRRAVRDAAADQDQDPQDGHDDGGDGGRSSSSREEIEAEWARKMEQMRDVFEKARPKEERRRQVPDWAIDDISFCVMVDPVIVRSLHAPFFLRGAKKDIFC